MNNKDFQYQYELKKVVGDGVSTFTITPPYYVGDPVPNSSVPLEPIWPKYYPNIPFMPRLTPESEEAIKKQVEEWGELQEEKNKQPNKVQPGTASRFNKGKRRWNLMPLDILAPIVEVLEFGADSKYSAWNFTEGDGLSWSETLNSMKNHLTAWERGEELDPESGLPHLGHAGCNLFFLLYYMKYAEKYNVRDDRKKR